MAVQTKGHPIAQNVSRLPVIKGDFMVSRAKQNAIGHLGQKSFQP